MPPTSLPKTGEVPPGKRSLRRLKLRVLVVDDHTDSRELYRDYLHHAGWVAHAVANGDEAISAAKEFGPSVIVMDLEMPVLDGIEATRRLKRDPATRHVHVLVLTSSEDKADEALAAGCDAYLTKPCLPQNLMAVLEQIVSDSSSASSLAARGAKRTMKR
jgi:two-component system, cell cycle response regulator DivK